MKRIILIFPVVALIGCAGGGESAPASPYDGTYVFNNIECYDSTLTSLTNEGTFQQPYEETAVLSGGVVTSTIVTQGCTISGSSSVNIGATKLDLTNRVVTSVTNLSHTNVSCTINDTLTNTNITLQNPTETFSTAETEPSLFGVPYLYNPTNHTLGLLSAYTDPNGGYCFEVFIKQ